MGILLFIHASIGDARRFYQSRGDAVNVLIYADEVHFYKVAQDLLVGSRHLLNIV